jgi:hypothetical protein
MITLILVFEKVMLFLDHGIIDVRGMRRGAQTAGADVE